jgi:DNA polymerase-3 subunit beta
MLYDIVRKLPDGAQLELEQGPDHGRVSITAGRSRFALQALPPEDYPDLASGEMAHNFTLSATDLRNLIEKTRFAISTEETRYYLNGIYLHEAGNGTLLRAVATDGHRLAQAEVKRPEGAKGMPGIIVPRKTVLEVVKLFEGHDGDVEVSLSSSKIRFSAANLVLTSKLIDGTFPDYERVIPRNNDKVLEADTKLFADAVDRVSTISMEKGRAVKLNIAGGKLVLTVNNPDSGSAEEEIACTYDSEPIDIGFNSRYLLDVAGQVKSGMIRFNLAGAGSPTIVRDPEDDQALYVLMPMRV